MVVRTLIGSMVLRLPYSHKIPVSIKSVFDETPSSTQEVKQELPEPDLGPAEKIRLRLMSKRTAADPLSSSSSTKMETFVDADDGVFLDEDVIDTWKPSMRDGPNPITEKYLNEQNEEFKSLINRNLKEVIPQQDSYADDLGWQRLVLELAMARNSTEVTSKVNLLMNKFSETAYSYIPFVQSDHQHHIPTSSLEITGNRNEALDILNDMEYDTKVLLLKQLAIDLGMGTSTKDLEEYTKNLTLSNEATMIDKVELLCLLSVRLSFICLKSFLPICQLLYEKFRKDEIILVNNKNFGKLLSILIRAMEGFERKMANSKRHDSGHV